MGKVNRLHIDEVHKAATWALLTHLLKEAMSAQSRLCVLSALNTAFVVAIALFGIDSSYEERVFHRIVVNSATPSMNDEARAVALLHAMSQLVGKRSDLLTPVDDEGRTLRERIFGGLGT